VVLGVAARSADELAELAEVGAGDAVDDTAGAPVLDRRGEGVDEQAVNAMTATAAMSTASRLERRTPHPRTLRCRDPVGAGGYADRAGRAGTEHRPAWRSRDKE
jgi:hypothetical protein